MEQHKPKATRAKCLLCGTIAESYFETDRGACACGEVSVIGGEKEAYRDTTGTLANCSILDNTANGPTVERKDNKGTEIIENLLENGYKPRTREELLEELKRLIEADLNLPECGHRQPASCVDLANYMVVMYEILKLEGK